METTLSVHQQIKKMWQVHTMEGKMEGIPSICSNMGGPGEHKAKWNEPDKERQILHAITYVGKSFLKKVRLIETE